MIGRQDSYVCNVSQYTIENVTDLHNEGYFVAITAGYMMFR